MPKRGSGRIDLATTAFCADAAWTDHGTTEDDAVNKRVADALGSEDDAGN